MQIRYTSIIGELRGLWVLVLFTVPLAAIFSLV